MFCNIRGRGHIHLTECKAIKDSDCMLQMRTSKDNRVLGRRHQTKDYKTQIKLDELTHDEYWNQSGFEDPSTNHTQKESRMCRCVYCVLFFFDIMLLTQLKKK